LANFCIPSLFFETQNTDDHSWHGYEYIISTDKIPTDKRAIEELINSKM
jgi:hypothetical protein